METCRVIYNIVLLYLIHLLACFNKSQMINWRVVVYNKSIYFLFLRSGREASQHNPSQKLCMVSNWSPYNTYFEHNMSNKTILRPYRNMSCFSHILHFNNVNQIQSVLIADRNLRNFLHTILIIIIIILQSPSIWSVLAEQ